jgi:hypothetical protein
MKKLLLAILLFMVVKANAQIEILTVLNRKPESRYIVGFGAMLKFGYPISEADDVSLELGFKFVPEIEYPDSYGIAYIPIKAGYRYTLDRSGTGFYAEPQIGYSVYGARSYQDESGMDVDEKITGPVGGLSFGYLFQRNNIIQLDLSLRYEAVFYQQTSAHTFGLRLSHNFSFRRNEY